jgi:tetratricopeptide (TPR) repeat protein
MQPFKGRNYEEAAMQLESSLALQVTNLTNGNNAYLAGITAHNLGVLRVLTGRDEEAERFFREAVSLKEAAFGQHQHHEVALSWGELGVLYFARGDFERALTAFCKAHELEVRGGVGSSEEIAMILNNIAGCNFQMGDRQAALCALVEARDLQRATFGTAAQADLDLLHVAIVICNCGYLNLAFRRYDEARLLFDEALMIQQSVLGDSHRAIRDTLSNIEFTNAFHSLD